MRLTGCSFDSLLRQALVEAIWTEWGDTLKMEESCSAHSPSYRRRRMQLLANPVLYARQRTRPLWLRALRKAACILLVLVLVTGGILCISPHARDWAVHTSEAWLAGMAGMTSAQITPPSAAGNTVTDWQLSYLPNGYAQIMRIRSSQDTMVVYENDLHNRICFSFSPYTEGESVLAEYQVPYAKAVWVGGKEGLVFSSQSVVHANHIIWGDQQTQLSFHIIADTSSTAELLKMAEGVSPLQKG